MYPTHQLYGLTRSIALAPVIALLIWVMAGCASFAARHAAQWPTPQLAYTHAATSAQAAALVSSWVAQPGNLSWNSRGVSMRPWLYGGPDEFHLGEHYRGQPVRRGMVVVMRRVTYQREWDSNGILIVMRPATEEWLTEHMVVEVSNDGLRVLLDGTNNKGNDGWQDVANIERITRAIITRPHGSARY